MISPAEKWAAVNEKITLIYWSAEVAEQDRRCRHGILTQSVSESWRFCALKITPSLLPLSANQAVVTSEELAISVSRTLLKDVEQRAEDNHTEDSGSFRETYLPPGLCVAMLSSTWLIGSVRESVEALQSIEVFGTKKKITLSCVIWIVLGDLSHPWIKLTFLHRI